MDTHFESSLHVDPGLNSFQRNRGSRSDPLGGGGNRIQMQPCRCNRIHNTGATVPVDHSDQIFVERIISFRREVPLFLPLRAMVL